MGHRSNNEGAQQSFANDVGKIVYRSASTRRLGGEKHMKKNHFAPALRLLRKPALLAGQKEKSDQRENHQILEKSRKKQGRIPRGTRSLYGGGQPAQK